VGGLQDVFRGAHRDPAVGQLAADRPRGRLAPGWEHSHRRRCFEERGLLPRTQHPIGTSSKCMSASSWAGSVREPRPVAEKIGSLSHPAANHPYGDAKGGPRAQRNSKRQRGAATRDALHGTAEATCSFGGETAETRRPSSGSANDRACACASRLKSGGLATHQTRAAGATCARFRGGVPMRLRRMWWARGGSGVGVVTGPCSTHIVCPRGPSGHGPEIEP